jgi:hypothetical protein
MQGTPPMGLMTKKYRWIVASAAVALIVMVGFALSRLDRPRMAPLSPDDQRVHDVLSLSWRIMFYARTKGHLPAALSDLQEDDWKNPVDPVTSSPYFYEVRGRDSFRLCAVFLFAAHQDEDQGADFLPPSCHQFGAVCYGDPGVHTYGAWGHDAGRQCLDRDVPFMGMAPSLH